MKDKYTNRESTADSSQSTYRYKEEADVHSELDIVQEKIQVVKQNYICDLCGQNNGPNHNLIHDSKSKLNLDDQPIWEQFDKSFLVVMILCNFTQGFKQILDLSLHSLYKDTMKL